MTLRKPCREQRKNGCEKTCNSNSTTKTTTYSHCKSVHSCSLQRRSQAMWQVYRQPLFIVHRTTVCSLATLFQIAAFAVCVVVPFIIGYGTHGTSRLFVFTCTSMCMHFWVCCVCVCVASCCSPVLVTSKIWLFEMHRAMSPPPTCLQASGCAATPSASSPAYTLTTRY